MNNILRVCTSENLPILADRQSNYLYFVYDKMQLYFGRDIYRDSFCIVETVPLEPVEGMLYITLTGDLKVFLGDTLDTIGTIEDVAQIDLLKKAGTTYFMHAESRYLDLQTRTIQLPFQNGNYQLSVSMTQDLMIDEDTVITYDPATRQFVINGNYQQNIKYLKNYKATNTSTVNTTIDNNSIKSEVKVSNKVNNMIKAQPNGLYIDISSKVELEDFNKVLFSYIQYKNIVDGYIKELRAALLVTQNTVSAQTINQKIISALEEYKPTIIDCLDNYNEIYDQLQTIEQNSKNYTDQKFNLAKQEIVTKIDGVQDAWNYFSGDSNYELGTDPAVTTNILSPDQLAVQTMILSAMRKQFLYLTDLNTPGATVDLNFFSIFDRATSLDELPYKGDLNVFTVFDQSVTVTP